MNKMPREYKVIDFPPLTDEEKAILDGLANTPDSEIDCSEIPDSTGSGNVGFYYSQSLQLPKTDIHIRIDTDSLDWIKKAGKGYQARLNNVIRWARLNHCPIAQL